MKRSKHIQLVLVTAALASCNRMIIPSDPSAGYVPDSRLTAVPAYIDSTSDCACDLDSTNNSTYPYGDYDYNYPYYYSYYPYYSFYYYPYYNPYYPYGYYGFHGSSYMPSRPYRKGAFWRNSHFIVRGGFGKAGFSAAT